MAIALGFEWAIGMNINPIKQKCTPNIELMLPLDSQSSPILGVQFMQNKAIDTGSDYAEGKTRTARRTKDREVVHADESHREGGTGEAGGGSGSFGSGTSGISRAGQTTDNPIVGGILSQLIDDAEKDVERTQECIEWYQRELEEKTQRLEDLKRLRELEQS